MYDVFKRISYFDYLIRYDYYKLHGIKPLNKQDEVMLNVALAAGSNNLAPTNTPQHIRKITNAHNYLYKQIKFDFKYFEPILTFPYNYSNLHHILSHNLVFAFANNIISIPYDKQMYLLSKSFNSLLEVKISYGYYMLIRVLHYAKTGKHSIVANKTLDYIRDICFPFFDLNNDDAKEIAHNFNKFYDEPYTNLINLKKAFRKYSNFYSFQFGMHFLGYLVHKSLITYPKFFNGTAEIMSILRSIQLHAAKYLLSTIYNFPSEKLPDFKSPVNHKEFYRLSI